MDLPTGKPRDNFDTFLIAFYTAFQVMTAENWNGNVIDYMRSPAIPIFIPPVYLVSWIFIGNYVLLNLFLAILLDSFLEEDGEDGVDLEEMARLAELKRRANVEREKIRRLKKLGASTVRSGIGHIPGTGSNGKSKKSNLPFELIFDDVDDMDNKHLTDLFIEIGIIKRKDKEREEANMFLGVEANKSLYLFSKTNRLRIYAYKLYKWKVFENFIMFLIALSSLKLAAATYEKYLPADSLMLVLSDKFDVVLNILFLFECVTKLISIGFIMDEGSYIRDAWN
jgi:Ion transport protein